VHMKTLLLTITFSCAGLLAFAQSPVGIWKTIDDETGEAKSYVKIYETKDGKLQGEVAQILTPGKENATCIKCTGDKKDKPVKGMMILWGLKKDGDEWSGGQVLDPEKGKQYKCYIKMKGTNQLELRGFIGISLIGRTQVWERVQ
jgi:uncharacterized protein (DUF2147 family)